MTVIRKDMGTPDETMSFDHGSVQVVRIGAFTFRLNTFEPGWQWSTSIKPMATTDSCQVHHVGYLLSGRLGVTSNTGSDMEINAGEAYEIMPGHDGWVVGDEAVRSIEFAGPEAEPSA
jgi:hypothetical protein